jgi:hypothetical protein
MIAAIYARKSTEPGPDVVLCPQCWTAGETEDDPRGGP